ncbi:MAG: AAA family ATPase [Gammaproteobacteria bacterium]
MSVREQILGLKAGIARDIIGQEEIVERLIIGLLANGNLLVEGLPGLAKTRAVKSLAKNLDAGLSRIQFTPDLLPADVTGTEVYYTDAGQGEFRFQPGPIFNNIVLADEINRAPAKVQAALLEAMEERQVTVAGTTHKLPDVFMVMATQNPIEQEGTYPLPEAQMDRFLMHVMIGYPDEAAETEILKLVRGETAGQSPASDPMSLSQQTVLDARQEIAGVTISPAIDQYIVDLVFASRYPDRYEGELQNWIEVGASPRGGIALDICARTHAWLNGNDFVAPENVRAVVHNCLRHRLILSYQASADGVSADDAVAELVKQVAVP